MLNHLFINLQKHSLIELLGAHAWPLAGQYLLLNHSLQLCVCVIFLQLKMRDQNKLLKMKISLPVVHPLAALHQRPALAPQAALQQPELDGCQKIFQK